MLGAISLSSSSHFPPMLYSAVMKPVTLPPGRARLSTTPAATGSKTAGNTIGTVRVSCSNGTTMEMPLARMTSGLRATNSAAGRGRRPKKPRRSGAANEYLSAHLSGITTSGSYFP
jgi:hypothetical protein